MATEKKTVDEAVTEKKPAVKKTASETAKKTTTKAAEKPAAKKPATKKAADGTAKAPAKKAAPKAEPAAKKEVEAETAPAKTTKAVGKKKTAKAGLTIRLTKSLAGRLAAQIETAKSLGLRRIGDTTVQPDSAATRGKIAKISHMVEVIESK